MAVNGNTIEKDGAKCTTLAQVKRDGQLTVRKAAGNGTGNKSGNEDSNDQTEPSPKCGIIGIINHQKTEVDCKAGGGTDYQ